MKALWKKQSLLVLGIIGFGALLAVAILQLDPSAAAMTEAAEEAEEGHEGEREEQGNRAHIEFEAADAAGLEIATAGPAEIRQTLVLQGDVEYDVQRVRRVMARYPGLVLDLNAAIGDRVEAGDVLAEVESNESLQPYAIRAPIDGVVTQQLVNVGETTGEGGLYVIADTSQLWVDLAVFRSDRPRIETGQPVRVRSLDGELKAVGEIAYIAPVSSPVSQSTTARVFLDNPGQAWQPGMAVTGEVTVAESAVPVAVQSSALQTFQGADVVFVRVSDDTYEPRPLQLGSSDGAFTQILSGLAAGAEYVARNSYLIKAELEKASAEHAH